MSAAALDRARERRLPLRFLGEDWPARLPAACHLLADRFARGGRLVAVSHAAFASDAHHVAVEFVHPVIVGKRAVPSLAVVDPRGGEPLARRLPAIGPDDVVVAIAGEGDAAALRAAVAAAHACGAAVLALEAGAGDLGKDAAVTFALRVPTGDAHVAKEGFVCAYHLLWEGVHVALEAADRAGTESAETAGLYPFLAADGEDPGVAHLGESVAAKLAETAALRECAFVEEGARLAACAEALAARLAAGGTVHAFGNGGSATDAEAVAARLGTRSLASDPALLTALANDAGFDAVFARQIDAFARAPDVAIALSTSGGSRNVLRALETAHRRGLLTIGFAGYDGGEMHASGLLDFSFVVPSQSVHRIQEVQTTLHHVLAELGTACAS